MSDQPALSQSSQTTSASQLPTFPPAAKPSTILTNVASSHINAPASVALGLLLSPSTWATWNPFAPTVTIRHDPSPPSNPVKIVPGLKMTMHAILNPAKPTAVNDLWIHVNSITYDEKERRHEVIWRIEGYSDWMLKAVRRQEFYELGDSECEYRTFEEMEGYLAYAIKYFLPGAEVLASRFRAWADGLKLAAEREMEGETE